MPSTFWNSFAVRLSLYIQSLKYCAKWGTIKYWVCNHLKNSQCNRLCGVLVKLLCSIISKLSCCAPCVKENSEKLASRAKRIITPLNHLRGNEWKHFGKIVGKLWIKVDKSYGNITIATNLNL